MGLSRRAPLGFAHPVLLSRDGTTDWLERRERRVPLAGCHPDLGAPRAFHPPGLICPTGRMSVDQLANSSVGAPDFPRDKNSFHKAIQRQGPFQAFARK